MSDKVLRLRGEMQVGMPTRAGLVYSEEILRRLVDDINEMVENKKPVVGTVLSRHKADVKEDEVTHEVVGAEYKDGRIFVSVRLLDNSRAEVLERLAPDVSFVPKMVVKGGSCVEKFLTMKAKLVTDYDELVRVDIGVE